MQIPGTDADPFFVGEGEADAARELVAWMEDAPGNRSGLLHGRVPDALRDGDDVVADT